MGASLTFALRGPAGEPVDLRRTISSHGVASLPPLSVDEPGSTLTATLALPGARPRTVVITQGRPGSGAIRVIGPAPSERLAGRIVATVRHVLALDRDLSGFYAAVASDPDLSWTARGAGRMIRSQTVFEEVVKTICTTNCAWSATVRMVGALVEHLGEQAPGAPPAGPAGRAFPTPAAMAEAGDDFYRDVVRAGYRGAYLRKLAGDVASGTLDLERLGRVTPEELDDDALFRELIALPGVGPYAAAHIMMLIGRHSRPIFDSWTRPKYAKVSGKKANDAQISRRFARYGEHAGLAFWLYLTRDWLDA